MTDHKRNLYKDREAVRKILKCDKDVFTSADVSVDGRTLNRLYRRGYLNHVGKDPKTLRKTWEVNDEQRRILRAATYDYTDFYVEEFLSKYRSIFDYIDQLIQEYKAGNRECPLNDEEHNYSYNKIPIYVHKEGDRYSVNVNFSTSRLYEMIEKVQNERNFDKNSYDSSKFMYKLPMIYKNRYNYAVLLNMKRGLLRLKILFYPTNRIEL